MDHRRGRITRVTLAIPLLVAVAACTSTPSPSASVPPAATPEVTAPPATSSPAPATAPPTEAPTAPPETPATGAAPCEPSDLKASHGRIEGAAGSRLTTVVLSAAITCSVDAFPAFGIRDATGAALVGAPAGGPGRIDLDADATYEVDVRIANWCADEPAFPLTLELLVSGESVEVTGGSFPEAGDLPPCNGDTVGPVLEAGSWTVSGG